MLSDPNCTLPEPYVVLLSHIPKTGGTSLLHAFAEIFGQEHCFRHRARDDRTHQRGPGIEDVDEATRARFKFVAAHLPYGFHEFFSANPLYITVVREPVERLVSDYFYNLHYGAPKLREVARQLSLDEYFEYKLSMENSDLVNDGQIGFIVGHREGTFEEARDRIEKDYFLTATTRQVDELMLLCGYIFGKPDVSLVQRNVTDPGLKTQNLSREQEAKCREVNGGDALLHEYVENRFMDVARMYGL